MHPWPSRPSRLQTGSAGMMRTTGSPGTLMPSHACASPSCVPGGSASVTDPRRVTSDGIDSTRSSWPGSPCLVPEIASSPGVQSDPFGERPAEVADEHLDELVTRAAEGRGLPATHVIGHL